MKKLVLVFCMAMAMVVGTTVLAAETMPYDANVINNTVGNSVHMLTSVSDEGDQVVITLKNVRFTPIGVNTNGKSLKSPDYVAIYSGIMDAAGVRGPFVIAKVVDGIITFDIPNTAKIAGVPVAEHLWGRSVDGDMALVNDPTDPFVVSDNGDDLNTLAIGIVMYPNRRTVSLKPFGKLIAGKHPELK